jgi:glycolate oxidase iron-sulfur subunit
MQTSFTAEQLKDPDNRESEKVLRTCVHCGFCTATCPTYVLLGDELDSPRGRIYLMKQMLEGGQAPSANTVKHIDRCLSCLSCMTTCPSGVHYMHLVDHGRAYIEEHYRRPFDDRLARWLIERTLPYPRVFRFSLLGAWLARPFAGFLPGKLRPMLKMAPRRVPSPSPAQRPQVHQAQGERRARVALLTGCAQQVLAPQINEATIRLLTRHGVEVVVPSGMGCCGALTHHMGRERSALAFARNNIDVWTRELEQGGLDALVINTSGCGTTIKDYGFLFRTDPAYAEKAARIAGLAKDVTEFLATFGMMPASADADLVVAYHSACSMQHGQKLTTTPKKLLAQAGFTVKDVPEGHLCCGSAGTYNILQPEIADRLRDRKVANIERVRPDVIATGNIGCMTQIGSGTAIPIVHTVELLDWATGGPKPQALAPAS